MTIRIVTDSVCDIPQPTTDMYGIAVVPAYVNIGDQSFLAGVDLSRREFYEGLPHFSSAPTTAAPAPAAFTETYERLAAEGASQILSIHVSSTLSGILNAAIVLAHETYRDGTNKGIKAETREIVKKDIAMANQIINDRGKNVFYNNKKLGFVYFASKSLNEDQFDNFIDANFNSQQDYFDIWEVDNNYEGQVRSGVLDLIGGIVQLIIAALAGVFTAGLSLAVLWPIIVLSIKNITMDFDIISDNDKQRVWKIIKMQ